MIHLFGRWNSLAVSTGFLISILWLFYHLSYSPNTNVSGARSSPQFVNKLPTGQARKFKYIQFRFKPETDPQRDSRNLRRAQVKEAFQRAWSGYTEFAWLKDELLPLSGGYATTFGGWAATLVDSLDTLWIMDMRDEFENAVNAASTISFNTSEAESINVFETTIRYLGGFLGAYDVSDGAYPILLAKAVEVGNLLHKAFDTPSRMPITRWDWRYAFLDGTSQKQVQEAPDAALVAEIGSLSLEFTRLSQLTGDSKYYDAVYHVMEALEQSQRNTRVPGLWPTVVNAKDVTFTGGHFTISAMADSVYEYLPKEYMLLGGTVESYKTMYELALSAMKSAVFFRPMVPEPSREAGMEGDANSPIPAADILLSGNALWEPSLQSIVRESQAQHLGCFAGGMVALAAKVFGTEADALPIAQRLVNGCIWAYGRMPTGIMPEVFYVVPCEDMQSCDFDEGRWLDGMLERQRVADETLQDLSFKQKIERLKDSRGLQEGFTDIVDTRYILRPEAIESVFILYRITGDAELLEAGWRMFQAIERNTATSFGNAAIGDVTVAPPIIPEKQDQMESFWLAETLKYFYLLYSEHELMSLD